MNLQRPFTRIWQAVTNLPAESFVILTRKNLDAVMRICKHWGLAISGENIYSGEEGTSKSCHFRQIISRFGQGPFRFFDDCLANLLEIKQSGLAGIELFLPSWGYVCPEQLDRAKEADICVITEEEVLNLLG